MKTIGGYLGLDDFLDNEYYKGLVRLNFATNAMVYLALSKSIKRFFIPRYLCSSVRIALDKHGCRYEYYDIDSDFRPVFEKRLGSGEYILVVNYFGQLKDEEMLRLKEKYGNIIVDNSHAFYQKPLKGIDTFYSCRKFIGVTDGAYLSTEGREISLEADASLKRMSYLLGSYEESSSKYYTDFLKVEKSLDDEPLKGMSKLTRNILKAQDYEKIKTVRRENYDCLESGLNDINKLGVSKPLVPFVYPLYLKDGAAVRKKLIESGIYVPVLWPEILEERPKGSLEYEYALNILALPCDQRYKACDMKRVIEEVRRWLR